MLRRILERRRRRKRREEEVRRALESRGVAPRAARRLARLVASGVYTVEEAVEAYRMARRRRVDSLARRLAGREERGGASALARIGDVERELRGLVGLADLEVLAGSRRRRARGR